MKRLSPEHKEYLSFMVDLWQNMDGVSGEAKALYCCLATFENYKTNKCRPCQRRISRHLGICVNSLKKKFRELEEVDLLRREKIKPLIGRAYWEYTLYAPRPKERRKPSGKAGGYGKIVPFHSPSSANSIPSMTQEGGSTA